MGDDSSAPGDFFSLLLKNNSSEPLSTEEDRIWSEYFALDSGRQLNKGCDITPKYQEYLKNNPRYSKFQGFSYGNSQKINQTNLRRNFNNSRAESLNTVEECDTDNLGSNRSSQNPKKEKKNGNSLKRSTQFPQRYHYKKISDTHTQNLMAFRGKIVDDTLMRIKLKEGAKPQLDAPAIFLPLATEVRTVALPEGSCSKHAPPIASEIRPIAMGARPITSPYHESRLDSGIEDQKKKLFERLALSPREKCLDIMKSEAFLNRLLDEKKHSRKSSTHYHNPKAKQPVLFQSISELSQQPPDEFSHTKEFGSAVFKNRVSQEHNGRFLKRNESPKKFSYKYGTSSAVAEEYMTRSTGEADFFQHDYHEVKELTPSYPEFVESCRLCGNTRPPQNLTPSAHNYEGTKTTLCERTLVRQSFSAGESEWEVSQNSCCTDDKPIEFRSLPEYNSKGKRYNMIASNYGNNQHSFTRSCNAAKPSVSRDSTSVRAGVGAAMSSPEAFSLNIYPTLGRRASYCIADTRSKSSCGSDITNSYIQEYDSYCDKSTEWLYSVGKDLNVPPKFHSELQRPSSGKKSEYFSVENTYPGLSLQKATLSEGHDMKFGSSLKGNHRFDNYDYDFSRRRKSDLLGKQCTAQPREYIDDNQQDTNDLYIFPAAPALNGNDESLVRHFFGFEELDKCLSAERQDYSHTQNIEPAELCYDENINKVSHSTFPVASSPISEPETPQSKCLNTQLKELLPNSNRKSDKDKSAYLLLNSVENRREVVGSDQIFRNSSSLGLIKPSGTYIQNESYFDSVDGSRINNESHFLLSNPRNCYTQGNDMLSGKMAAPIEVLEQRNRAYQYHRDITLNDSNAPEDDTVEAVKLQSKQPAHEVCERLPMLSQLPGVTASRLSPLDNSDDIRSREDTCKVFHESPQVYRTVPNGAKSMESIDAATINNHYPIQQKSLNLLSHKLRNSCIAFSQAGDSEDGTSLDQEQDDTINFDAIKKLDSDELVALKPFKQLPKCYETKFIGRKRHTHSDTHLQSATPHEKDESLQLFQQDLSPLDEPNALKSPISDDSLPSSLEKLTYYSPLHNQESQITSQSRGEQSAVSNFPNMKSVKNIIQDPDLLQVFLSTLSSYTKDNLSAKTSHMPKKEPCACKPTTVSLIDQQSSLPNILDSFLQYALKESTVMETHTSNSSNDDSPSYSPPFQKMLGILQQFFQLLGCPNLPDSSHNKKETSSRKTKTARKFPSDKGINDYKKQAENILIKSLRIQIKALERRNSEILKDLAFTQGNLDKQLSINKFVVSSQLEINYHLQKTREERDQQKLKMINLTQKLQHKEEECITLRQPIKVDKNEISVNGCLCQKTLDNSNQIENELPKEQVRQLERKMRQFELTTEELRENFKTRIRIETSKHQQELSEYLYLVKEKDKKIQDLQREIATLYSAASASGSTDEVASKDVPLELHETEKGLTGGKSNTEAKLANQLEEAHNTIRNLKKEIYAALTQENLKYSNILKYKDTLISNKEKQLASLLAKNGKKPSLALKKGRILNKSDVLYRKLIRGPTVLPTKNFKENIYNTEVAAVHSIVRPDEEGYYYPASEDNEKDTFEPKASSYEKENSMTHINEGKIARVSCGAISNAPKAIVQDRKTTASSDFNLLCTMLEDKLQTTTGFCPKKDSLDRAQTTNKNYDWNTGVAYSEKSSLKNRHIKDNQGLMYLRDTPDSGVLKEAHSKNASAEASSIGLNADSLLSESFVDRSITMKTLSLSAQATDDEQDPQESSTRLDNNNLPYRQIKDLRQQVEIATNKNMPKKHTWKAHGMKLTELVLADHYNLKCSVPYSPCEGRAFPDDVQPINMEDQESPEGANEDTKCSSRALEGSCQISYQKESTFQGYPKKKVASEYTKMANFRAPRSPLDNPYGHATPQGYAVQTGNKFGHPGNTAELTLANRWHDGTTLLDNDDTTVFIEESRFHCEAKALEQRIPKLYGHTGAHINESILGQKTDDLEAEKVVEASIVEPLELSSQLCKHKRHAMHKSKPPGNGRALTSYASQPLPLVSPPRFSYVKMSGAMSHSSDYNDACSDPADCLVINYGSDSLDSPAAFLTNSDYASGVMVSHRSSSLLSLQETKSQFQSESTPNTSDVSGRSSTGHKASTDKVEKGDTQIPKFITCNKGTSKNAELVKKKQPYADPLFPIVELRRPMYPTFKRLKDCRNSISDPNSATEQPNGLRHMLKELRSRKEQIRCVHPDFISNQEMYFSRHGGCSFWLPT